MFSFVLYILHAKGVLDEHSEVLQDFMLRKLELNFQNYLGLLTNMANDEEVGDLLSSVMKKKEEGE